MKTQSKHTPGSWHHNEPFTTNIKDRGECRMIGIGGSGAHIGYASITGCVPLEQAKANAQLIASAPDLLLKRDELARALKDCLEQIDHLWDHLGSDKQRFCRPTTISCQDQARAALASVEKDGVEA